jgi:translation initiation factor 3 subunit J
MPEFEEYTSLLLEKFQILEKHPLYITFLDGFVRQVCENLTKSDDVRKIGSTVNTLANEKLRLEKEASKKNKKGSVKKQVRVEADEYSAPGTFNEETYDEYEDL